MAGVTSIFTHLCPKHPELGGERRAASRMCVQCSRDMIKAWRAKNKDVVAANNRRRYEEDPVKAMMEARFRKRKIRDRTPIWADRAKIRDVYREAKRLGMTVDHVVPLCGKNVSGLHVENNLRIVSKSENDKKGRNWPVNHEGVTR